MLHQNVIIYMARGKRRGPEANDALQRAATICRERGARDPVPRTRSGPLRERERERERDLVPRERGEEDRERDGRSRASATGGKDRGARDLIQRERYIFTRSGPERTRKRVEERSEELELRRSSAICEGSGEKEGGSRERGGERFLR